MDDIKITRFKSIISTNTYAMQNISLLEDRQVIIAEYQESGKGRLGRKWISDNSKNAYVSVVLKPDNENFPYSNVTQYLSVILCQLLEDEYKITPSIKWPNDILVDGSKLSGILCEAKTKGNKIEALVLGFGVNLNMPKETLEKIDQKATSLKVLLNRDIDSESFINKVLERFFDKYNQFSTLGFQYIKEDYIKRCDFLGKGIKIKSNDGIQEYLAESINDDGTLTVSDADRIKKQIISGDLL